MEQKKEKRGGEPTDDRKWVRNGRHMGEGKRREAGIPGGDPTENRYRRCFYEERGGDRDDNEKKKGVLLAKKASSDLKIDRKKTSQLGTGKKGKQKYNYEGTEKKPSRKKRGSPLREKKNLPDNERTKIWKNFPKGGRGPPQSGERMKRNGPGKLKKSRTLNYEQQKEEAARSLPPRKEGLEGMVGAGTPSAF